MAAFASKIPLDAYLFNLAKSLVGCFIVRCSGCTINDILDRDYDAVVGESIATQGTCLGRVTWNL